MISEVANPEATDLYQTHDFSILLISLVATFSPF